MTPIVDLTGRRGLVIGIANESSIAYGCARWLRAAGAELGITYLNAKARPYVEPLASELGATIVMPCDVSADGQLESVFAHLDEQWGSLDFVLHSIAFAPRDDLHAPLIEASASGFATAMDISCHSFIRTARCARPLMKDGGTLTTVSYFGAERVVDHYNLMGPVKAALEASVRALAVDLADENIRVFALSAGPVATRAASGIEHFDSIIDEARDRTPAHRLMDIDQIGRVSAFLASDAGGPLTGSVVYADGGFHVHA